MQWMGVYGEARSDGGDISRWFSRPKSAVLPHVDRVGLEGRVRRIEDKINVGDVEKILGYKFRWFVLNLVKYRVAQKVGVDLQIWGLGGSLPLNLKSAPRVCWNIGTS